MRKLSAVLALLLLAWPAAHAGQVPVAGNWKITFLDQGNLLTFWILKVESKDGKLSGSVVTTDNNRINLPETSLGDLTFKDGQLQFELKLPNLKIAFDCKVPKGEVKKLHGTMMLQGQTIPVQLESTKLDTLKGTEAIVQPDAKGTFKELKDKLTKLQDDLGIFGLTDALVSAAATEKSSAAELKETLAPVLKFAADYGDAFVQNVEFGLAARLAKNPAYAQLAEQMAHKILNNAGPKAPVDLLLRVNSVLVTSLENQGKAAEAGKVGEELARKLLKDAGPKASFDLEFRMTNLLATSLEKQGKTVEAGKVGEEFARKLLKDAGADPSVDLQIRVNDMLAINLEKQGNKAAAAKAREIANTLELKEHEENEKAGLGFMPTKFEGRKGNKTVLVELFTGAQCPPCVAADLGFEALAKTYTSGEVMLLQYHLHIPAPDPMTNKDTEARQQYYGSEVRGTPSIFFNGKPAAGGGGFKAQAEGKYKAYCDVIDPLLQGETKIKVSAQAKRDGDNLTVTATASGYNPGEKLKLRFALIEPWVRYPGSNGLSFHAHVVRALPGGPEGFTLNKDSANESATVNLRVLREQSSQELDEFPNLAAKRPFSYRNLHAVAFLQNDETREVLAAVEVPVK
jgi:hypothetical protein